MGALRWFKPCKEIVDLAEMFHQGKQSSLFVWRLSDKEKSFITLTAEDQCSQAGRISFSGITPFNVALPLDLFGPSVNWWSDFCPHT